MERTKSIRHASFRKSWSVRHLTPVVLAVIAVFMLVGCERSDKAVSLYQNTDDYFAANPGKSAECTTAFNNIPKEAEHATSKYTTREDCIIKFGKGQCQQVPAQAGIAPTDGGRAQTQNQSNGSFWISLVAGYMMSQLMGGGMGAQQPLFSSRNPVSPAYGKYTDASDRNYSTATSGYTITIPGTAMVPKFATTSTVTHGRFGEFVAKQSTMQHNASGTTTHSMGG